MTGRLKLKFSENQDQDLEVAGEDSVVVEVLKVVLWHLEVGEDFVVGVDWKVLERFLIEVDSGVHLEVDFLSEVDLEACVEVVGEDLSEEEDCVLLLILIHPFRKLEFMYITFHMI